ncbi:hypothetical protein [Nocardia vinacea]|uniref:hypothetical protein n=1 Tax=Nocardia vinacea TaxID=96468 RepID=UPI00031F70F4|nr:hypothetical protein [Nocardia vinacea]
MATVVETALELFAHMRQRGKVSFKVTTDQYENLASSKNLPSFKASWQTSGAFGHM